MNSFCVNKYNSTVDGTVSSRLDFIKDGSVQTQSFDTNLIDRRTKVCLISVGDSKGQATKIETLWYTFDGGVPSSTNGHKLISNDLMELSVGALRVARFSNDPALQKNPFILRMEQLTN